MSENTEIYSNITLKLQQTPGNDRSRTGSHATRNCRIKAQKHPHTRTVDDAYRADGHDATVTPFRPHQSTANP